MCPPPQRMPALVTASARSLPGLWQQISAISKCFACSARRRSSLQCWPAAPVATIRGRLPLPPGPVFKLIFIYGRKPFYVGRARPISRRRAASTTSSFKSCSPLSGWRCQVHFGGGLQWLVVVVGLGDLYSGTGTFALKAARLLARLQLLALPSLSSFLGWIP